MAFAVAGIAAGGVLAEGFEFVRRRQWLSVNRQNRNTVKRLIERLAFAFYREIGEDDQAVLGCFRDERIEEAIAELSDRIKRNHERLATSKPPTRARSHDLHSLALPHLKELLGTLLSRSIALEDRDLARALENLAKAERHWARAILLSEFDNAPKTEAWHEARNTLDEAGFAYGAASNRKS
jgi:hypothetical protein